MSSAGSGPPAPAGPSRPGYAAGQLLASVVVLLLALPLLPLVLLVIAWARCRNRHSRATSAKSA